jgi:glycogen(starch) synthase
VVRNGVTGLSFEPGDVAGIATAVRAVLDDPKAAQTRARAARARLRSEFDWDQIAAATARVYAGATRRRIEAIGRPKIPTGNAFGP